MKQITLTTLLILMMIINRAFAEQAITGIPNANMQQASQALSCPAGTICYQRVSTSLQLLASVLRCDQLGDAVVVYQPPSDTRIEINLLRDSNSACIVVVKNNAATPPSSHACIMTKEEVAGMATPQAQNYLKHYDETAQPLDDAQMSTLFGAFYRCMKGNVNPTILANQITN